jgi:hypothetical protein
LHFPEQQASQLADPGLIPRGIHCGVVVVVPTVAVAVVVVVVATCVVVPAVDVVVVGGTVVAEDEHPVVCITSPCTRSDQPPPVSWSATQKKAPPLQ